MTAPAASLPGFFLSFEGSEGCGKSTQIRLLRARLEAAGQRVEVLREPGGTPVGEEVRHLLYPVTSSRAHVTYAWSDSAGEHQESRTLNHDETWNLPTGQDVRTRWVELSAE